MRDIVSVQSLTAGYKKKEIIRDFNFTIKEGQTVGLIGLNGAGKTTLIKAITGLIHPYSGEVIIDRDQLSYLPENFEPPLFLSGLEYIRFCLRCYKQNNIHDNEIQRGCDLVGLSFDVLDQKVKTYSKGMRQKLGVLGNYLTGCKFLILDEPMSGLDPKAHADIKMLIKKAKEEGVTILLSIHNLHDLEILCDAVLLVNEGQLLFQGSVDAMISKSGADNAEQAFLSLISVPLAA